MANLTMALDDSLMLSARRVAFERDTSLSELVRGYLTELVEDWNRGKTRSKALIRTFERNSVKIGKRNWSREDLYARGYACFFIVGFAGIAG